jgi:hypothetical protein
MKITAAPRRRSWRHLLGAGKLMAMTWGRRACGGAQELTEKKKERGTGREALVAVLGRKRRGEARVPRAWWGIRRRGKWFLVEVT